MEHKNFSLPFIAVSRTDVARLAREVESLEDYIHQANLRSPGHESDLKMPKTSRMLDELATENSLNLLDADSRRKLLNSLNLIRDKAPVVHMSFSVEPSAAFMQKMVMWWRANIDPYVLLEAGLQPNIAIGCVVRTPNHQYDFSLRERLMAKQSTLAKMLEPTEVAA